MATRFVKGKRTQGEGTQRSDKLPHGPDNLYYPFLFKHQSIALGGWEVAPVLDDRGRPLLNPDGDTAYCLIPRLHRFKIIPGIQGVQQGKNEEDGPDFTMAKGTQEQEGWQFLPVNVLPGFPAFGEKDPEGGGYLSEYPAKRGTAYADVWTRPSVTGTGKKAKTKWSADEVGFQRFRMALVEHGIIALPDQEVIDTLIRMQEDRIHRNLRDVHIPSVKEAVERDGVKLAAMRKIEDAIEEGAEDEVVHTLGKALTIPSVRPSRAGRAAGNMSKAKKEETPVAAPMARKASEPVSSGEPRSTGRRAAAPKPGEPPEEKAEKKERIPLADQED